jgi:hypothetical protein
LGVDVGINAVNGRARLVGQRQILVNERQYLADAAVDDRQIVRRGLQVGGQRVQIGAGRLQVRLQAAHTLRQAFEAGLEAARRVLSKGTAGA